MVAPAKTPSKIHSSGENVIQLTEEFIKQIYE